MKRTNKKGGAAIVAVLIVIMLVAVGSAALVVTGRYTIQASKVADAVVKVNSNLRKALLRRFQRLTTFHQLWKSL